MTAVRLIGEPRHSLGLMTPSSGGSIVYVTIRLRNGFLLLCPEFGGGLDASACSPRGTATLCDLDQAQAERPGNAV